VTARSQEALLSPRSRVLVAIVAIVVATRLVIRFIPGVVPYNFTPVEAIALFGGAYFVDRRLAFAVPLTAMVVADILIALSLPANWIGDWLRALPAVYGCVALTTFAGLTLRERVTGVRVGVYAFASAVFFFAVTNFATWLTARPEAGEACAQGLMACYVIALPFFRGTLLGTLFWTIVLFGGFEFLQRRWPALRPSYA
jgi:hypothetical protein